METGGRARQHQPSYYDGFGADVMPVVEYYPTAEYFEQLDAVQEDRDLDSDGVETRFVNHWGWDTPQWQSLYQAERKYDLYGGDSCIWCHNPDFWRDRIGLQNWDAYEEDNPYEHEPPRSHIEAWTTENAGADNDVVGTPPLEQIESEDEIFSGGFAGICPIGEEFGYDDSDPDPDDHRWRCGGHFDWEQPVLLPEIETPHTEETNIGLAVMHTSIENPGWIEEDYWEFAEEVEDQELETMDASCWAGELDEKPDDCSGSDRCFEATGIEPASDSPFGVYGEVDMTDHSRYSCEWSFETDLGVEVNEDPDDLIMLHYAGYEGDSRFESIRQNHFENMDGIEEDTTYTSEEFAQQMDDWGIQSATG